MVVKSSDEEIQPNHLHGGFPEEEIRSGYEPHLTDDYPPIKGIPLGDGSHIGVCVRWSHMFYRKIHLFTKLILKRRLILDFLYHGCDAYSVVVLSDECSTGFQCELPDVHIPLKSQLSLDARLSNQSYINMMVENALEYSTCIVDVDLETGKSGTGANEETLGNLKNEEVLKNSLQKSLQKQISFDMGGKHMQLLMNHSLMLSKFSTRDKIATEKVLDAPRSRKFKRAPVSFNSRKVVLLFSVLSSLGTMILIYLTLRVRQIGDASIHSG